MPNFDAFQPHPVSRLNGQVDYQGPTKVLNGCATLAQNIRFTPDTAGTRYGTLTSLVAQQPNNINADITGFDTLEVLGLVNPGFRTIAFDNIGDLFIENPDGSGVLVPLTPPFPLPTAARMIDSTGDNNMLMAFEDGLNSLAPPIMYRGQTKQVMPISQTPLGAAWKNDTVYLVGDLVRSPDGRWWRCAMSQGLPSGPVAPLWPPFYGYFSINPPFNWVPASVVDSVSQSTWEEWTPACVQYLPAPNVDGATVFHNPGAGTIPAGLDVYIKVAYLSGNFQSPRSLPLIFHGTAASDFIFAGFGTDAGILGSLPMPRWVAEMFMNHATNNSVFVAASLLLNIYVAAVPAGGTPPLDSAYKNLGATTVPNDIIVPNIPTAAPAANLVTGCPVPNGPVPNGYNAITTTFMGQGGSRYMIPLRKDANASYAPVDPDAPIPVSFIGEIEVAIIEIARDVNGNVTATVGDITDFVPGQQISVQGCTGDPTFNGTFALGQSEQTLAPQGVLTWVDPNHLSASNDQTGAVLLPAGPLPTAFLPPGGPFDIQDIAAFTIASPLTGAPNNQNAGPFFFIPEADPSLPFETNITSMQGPLTINRTITSLQRFTGGGVNCILADITGITPGMTAIVQNQGDPDFNGSFEIQSVIPGTGFAGTLVWQQSINATPGGPGGGGLPLIIQQGTLGQVEATVQDASGLSAGDEVQISNSPVTAFNGLQTIASVLGDVVTFPSAATGQALVFTGTKVQFIGGVTATVYPHADHFAGQCELRNPVDGGNNPGQGTYGSVASSSNNSVQFNPPQYNGTTDPNIQPMQWATLDANGNITGYKTVAPQATQEYTMVVTFSLVFPTAGHFNIHIDHDDGIFWGMGNGASRVSGPTDCPAPAATVSALMGYPVMGAENESAPSTGWHDDYVVNIPSAGIYPIEIDFCNWQNEQNLNFFVNGVSPFGQYVPGPSIGVIGQMTLLQNLPTCSPAGPMNITSIQQDQKGNVTAQVDNLGGLENGQTVKISGPNFSTFFAGFGWVELTGADLNPDGLSGTISFVNPLFNQAPNAVFTLTAPIGWTVSAQADILINFDDSELESNFDVTAQLSTTGVYAATDAYFVPSIRQVAYVDNQHYPASFVFSNEDDPGNVVLSSGDPNNPGSGILVCQGADSSRAICVREIKDGPIIAMKENGGWQVNPSDTLPSQWNTSRRWQDYGPHSAELVTVGHNFIAFWDEERGPFVFTNGELEWIGKELSEDGTLKRVNTAALQNGWAAVNVSDLELKFGIPLDGATLPNYEFSVDYEGGWGFPEVVNRFGKLIVPREARKWSINPWTARCAKTVKRTLNVPAGGIVQVPPNDPRINTRQFLYGMPASPAPGNSVPLFKSVRQNGVVTFYWLT